MARPPEPATPADIILRVDGETPFVFVTPILRDHEGEPLIGRTCDVAVCETTPGGIPVHASLTTYARSLGDGSYRAELTPRALRLQLGARDGARLLLRIWVRGLVPITIPVRVQVVPATVP